MLGRGNRQMVMAIILTVLAPSDPLDGSALDNNSGSAGTHYLSIFFSRDNQTFDLS